MELSHWLVVNWATVGAWVGGCYTLYKLGSIVNAIVGFFNSFGTRFRAAEDALVRVEAVVGLLAGNHLPHIQAELEKSNDTANEMQETLMHIRDAMNGVREDLRMMLFKGIAEHE